MPVGWLAMPVGWLVIPVEGARGQGGERTGWMRLRRARMRRLLDCCENTFKDVFDRIDTMLDDHAENKSS